VIKQTRREILNALAKTYPIPLSFESICWTFVDLETHYLRRDMSYLEDKGYVVWLNKAANAAWSGRKYRLTAKGEEIASRLEIDPALEP